MVFPKGPIHPPPPGLPDVVIPPPGARPRTQLDRIEAMVLGIHEKLGLIVEGLRDDLEGDDEPAALTLDGQPAGKPRDQTQSLG